MTKKKNKMTAGKIVAVGAGVAALSATAYYFLGPNGKKNQKKAKAWMVGMEKDIEKKAKAVKDMSESVYHKIVDDTIKPYMAKNIPDTKEIKAYAMMLKKEWKGLTKKAIPAKKAVAKAKPQVKKVAKKVIKKVAPKTAKKK